ENNRIARDYIVNYTNAAFIVKDGFKLPEDGLYSGFDATTQIYDKSTWNYQEGGNMTPAAAQSAPGAGSAASVGTAGQQVASNFEQKKGPSEGGARQPGGASKEATSGGQGPLGGGHQAAGGPGASGQGGPNPPPML